MGGGDEEVGSDYSEGDLTTVQASRSIPLFQAIPSEESSTDKREEDDGTTTGEGSKNVDSEVSVVSDGGATDESESNGTTDEDKKDDGTTDEDKKDDGTTDEDKKDDGTTDEDKKDDGTTDEDMKVDDTSLASTIQTAMSLFVSGTVTILALVA